MPDQKRVIDEKYEVSLEKYEAAASVIGAMVAMRSGWLGEEWAKEQPDQQKIDLWNRERSEFNRLLDSVSFGDDTAADEIINAYSPIVKAHFGGGDK